MSATEILLWVIVPYISLAIFVVGHYWRYKYDKFGWTTRSSQLYERRLLRWGSPLFHFGILFVVAGHIVGLGIPSSWTEAVGMSEHTYHVLAVVTGALLFCAGLLLFVTTVFLFATRGRGTLAPWDPPSRLVVTGPYRYVRNPMIVGVIFIIIAESLVFRSWALA